MKRAQLPLFLLIVLAFVPGVAHAQAWSGILDPTRAIDWSAAGVPGGIPSGSWNKEPADRCGILLIPSDNQQTVALPPPKHCNALDIARLLPHVWVSTDPVPIHTALCVSLLAGDDHWNSLLGALTGCSWIRPLNRRP